MARQRGDARRQRRWVGPRRFGARSLGPARARVGCQLAPALHPQSVGDTVSPTTGRETMKRNHKPERLAGAAMIAIELSTVQGGADEEKKYPDGVGEGAGHLTAYDKKGMYNYSWANDVVQYSESLYGVNQTDKNGTVIQGGTHGVQTDIKG
jgi:hypothetical protein